MESNVAPVSKILSDGHLKRAAGGTLLVLSAVLLIFVYVVPKHTKPTLSVSVPTHTSPDAFAGTTISGKAAVVYDLLTGETLYQKNQYTQLPLASITKLLSVYAGTNTLARDARVTISQTALATEGDSGLAAGEVFAFSDLARFALVASSNDAAEAIAEAASSHIAVSKTNLLAGAAAAAGLSQTYALNGTGLDENGTVAGAYGSAKDIAILAGKLLQKAPDIARATILPKVTLLTENGKTITAKNTNPDVSQMPGLLLSKTGYTDLAGGNLVIVFDAGMGHPVAITVLGSTKEERFTDTNKLIAATLAYFADTTP